MKKEDQMASLRMQRAQKEAEILRLISAGAENAEIGRELGMAVRTVKKYCFQLYEKYGIADLRPHCKRARLVAITAECAATTTTPVLRPIESRIVQWVISGKTNEEIGAALGKTRHCVKNWLREIYDKTGMATRTELALWAAAKLGRLNTGRKKSARAVMPAPNYFFAEGGVSPLRRRYIAAAP
jgi:DNA-binding CsgD family transcriptional regulator